MSESVSELVSESVSESELLILSESISNPKAKTMLTSSEKVLDVVSEFVSESFLALKIMLVTLSESDVWIPSASEDEFVSKPKMLFLAISESMSDSKNDSSLISCSRPPNSGDDFLFSKTTSSAFSRDFLRKVLQMKPFYKYPNAVICHQLENCPKYIPKLFCNRFYSIVICFDFFLCFSQFLAKIISVEFLRRIHKHVHLIFWNSSSISIACCDSDRPFPDRAFWRWTIALKNIFLLIRYWRIYLFCKEISWQITWFFLHCPTDWTRPLIVIPILVFQVVNALPT